jgi:hypothetical protein
MKNPLIGVITALIIGGSVYLAYVGARTTVQDVQYRASSETARANTNERSFIIGCTEEGIAESYCRCAYYTLLNMYPDFATNMNRMNRIIRDGYNDNEIKRILNTCDVYEG